MSARRPRRALALLIAVGVALSGCGDDATGVSGEQLAQLADVLPGELLGLRVSEEEPGSTLGTVDSTYMTSFGLYALRDGDLLQATVQVGDLASEDRDVTSPEFRREVALNIGGQESQPFRMGDDTVYLTAGRKQSISIWFRDARMYVVSVRDTYTTPRTLLRALIENQKAEAVQ